MIRAVDGPLASVRGEAPEDVDYDGRPESARRLRALRASMRSVVDEVTLEDVVNDRLPAACATADRAAGRLVTPLSFAQAATGD